MEDMTGIQNTIAELSALQGQLQGQPSIESEIASLAEKLGNVIQASTDCSVGFTVGIRQYEMIFRRDPGFKDEPRAYRFVLRSDLSTKYFPWQDWDVPVKVEAIKSIPRLCNLLLQSKAQKVKTAVECHATVRAVRESIPSEVQEKAPGAFAVDDAAQEASSQYVHNFRVRYEGALEIVRKENERLHKENEHLHKELELGDGVYETLYHMVEDLFCGSQGDPRLVNLEALTKLHQFVREGKRTKP
jgi:hypothetical protein